MATSPITHTIFSSESYEEESFKNHNNDLLLIKNPKIESYSTIPFKNDSYILIICKKGSAKGKINLISHEIQAPGILVIRPDQLLQIESYSKDFEGNLLLAKEAYLSKMQLNVTDVLPMKFIMRLYSGPYVPMSEVDIDNAISYFNLMFNVVSNNTNPFLEASLANIICSFIYEAGYYVSKNMDDIQSPQQDPLVDRLLLLIKHYFREHRDVDFYAKKMHLSANYIYKVVKKTTGRTVTEWIEQMTITEAKTLLRDSSLSVQEIGEQLNFPSLSFFGKYFKRVAGVSPNEYRKSIMSR